MATTAAINQPEDFGFGDLFDLVTEAVIVADSPSGEIRLWNDAASRMFGFTRDQALGMPVTLIVPPELRGKHLGGIERFAADGTIRLTPPGSTVEVPALCRDGTQIWVELSLTALRGDQDRTVLALIRDVTDRRHAQDELQRANQALRNFVAVAAHDLRAPTSTITSGLQLLCELLDGTQVSGEAMELAELVERQARQQLSLIEDLLDTASLDAGTTTVRPETISVADAIASAANGAPDLHVSVPPGLACVADPRHLRRILMNLIVNAYRHGEAPVAINASDDGGTVTIRVCDAGEGVSAEVRTRLFDPYVAGSESAGTGLGLSIARGLARANGGDLSYEVTGDAAACFVVSFPLAPSKN
ncbi:MAG: hypothetical protein QOJ00_1021 [Actinomycetota bacterium]|jgi:PAS domain S-box-containing protein